MQISEKTKTIIQRIVRLFYFVNELSIMKKIRADLRKDKDSPITLKLDSEEYFMN